MTDKNKKCSAAGLPRTSYPFNISVGLSEHKHNH